MEKELLAVEINNHNKRYDVDEQVNYKDIYEFKENVLDDLMEKYLMKKASKEFIDL